MSFVSFLKATVLGCAASATLLAVIALAAAAQEDDRQVVAIAVVWWIAAGLAGAALGRSNDTSPPIAKLLSDAPMSSTLPETGPSRMLVNRLWPLLLATVGSAAFAFVAPQIPAIAAGFPLIWSLAWRKQESAVEAIEERDGVKFFLDRTSPIQKIRLIRTPWFRSGGQRRRESDPASDNGHR